MKWNYELGLFHISFLGHFLLSYLIEVCLYRLFSLALLVIIHNIRTFLYKIDLRFLCFFFSRVPVLRIRFFFCVRNYRESDIRIKIRTLAGKKEPTNLSDTKNWDCWRTYCRKQKVNTQDWRNVKIDIKTAENYISLRINCFQNETMEFQLHTKQIRKISKISPRVSSI